jgi:hypothetical protein
MFFFNIITPESGIEMSVYFLGETLVEKHVVGSWL